MYLGISMADTLSACWTVRPQRLDGTSAKPWTLCPHTVDTTSAHLGMYESVMYTYEYFLCIFDGGRSVHQHQTCVQKSGRSVHRPRTHGPLYADTAFAIEIPKYIWNGGSTDQTLPPMKKHLTKKTLFNKIIKIANFKLLRGRFYSGSCIVKC